MIVAPSTAGSSPRTLSVPPVTGETALIIRIVDVFPADQQQQVRTQLAATLQGVVCQTLVKTVDGKGRAAAVEIMRSHPDLFELENHGGHHIPAVDTPQKIYGIRSAGSPEAVQAEVESGAAALAQRLRRGDESRPLDAVEEPRRRPQHARIAAAVRVHEQGHTG